MKALRAVALLTAPLIVSAASIDPKAAKTAFREAEQHCQADHGQLWGRSLCGPILLVEPQTRDYITSTGETGTLPTELNMANTAFEWKGTRWTMVMWPLPQAEANRTSLLMHELWHRIQPELGLEAPTQGNAHLDTAEGRTLIQLEWRALAAALGAGGDARGRALQAALAFRRERRRMFPAAAAEENALEIAEGLAEYTGVRLSGEPNRLVLDALRDGATRSTFVRSFAYASGPAWGLVLDDLNPKWRQGLKADSDLTSLLPPLPACAAACLSAATHEFGGEELRAREEERAERNRRIVAEYQRTLVDGPVLTLPLVKANFQFNPTNLVPLPPHGTVYPGIRVSAAWGTLEVTSGAGLIRSDFGAITVRADGTGYQLKLKEGWKSAPGDRAGSFRIVPDKPEVRP